MRHIIGIGEAHYTIVFKDCQPERGYPDGFVFNSLVSLGRAGLNPAFITEVGNDEIGNLIIDFLKDNNVNIDNIYRYYEGNTALTIHIADNEKIDRKSEYLSYPEERLDMVWPRIDSDDIILFGSYFSIDNKIRKNLTDIITYASERKSLIIYDVDYDKSHAKEAVWFMPSIIENLEFADIVRGNSGDFFNIYKESDFDRIYVNHIKFYCKIFICLDGIRGVYLNTDLYKRYYTFNLTEEYNLKMIDEAFNAGLIYGLVLHKIGRDSLETLDPVVWDSIIDCGIEFVNNICKSGSHYISEEFAGSLNKDSY